MMHLTARRIHRRCIEMHPTALVAMKLQANRFIDRAHIQDMLSVGLIDDVVRATLPPDLLAGLWAIEAAGME